MTRAARLKRSSNAKARNLRTRPSEAPATTRAVNGSGARVLLAVAATGAFVAGLLFFRFCRESQDRLLAFFSAAFHLLALSWTLPGLVSPSEETRPSIDAIRLVAFVLIIIGIIDKNRKAQV